LRSATFTKLTFYMFPSSTYLRHIGAHPEARSKTYRTATPLGASRLLPGKNLLGKGMTGPLGKPMLKPMGRLSQ
jgi:hypothetical protein